MTPKEQLSLRDRHPDFQKFLDINEQESERVRQQCACHLDVPYGSSPLQTLDVFPSNKPKSPILVFIHGGYWRSLDKNSYSFVAEPFVNKGMTVCVINYRLIPTVNMETLLDDVHHAIRWIQQNAHEQKYNGDPSAIVLSGHSAGGHLALMPYLTNPSLRPNIKAICSLSGLFDLAPIRNSYLNETLGLTEEDVQSFSVINKDISVVQCPTMLSVGGGETDLFIQESKNLYNQHCKQMNSQHITYREEGDLNHYQIVHELGKEDSPLTKFILQHGIGSS